MSATQATPNRKNEKSRSKLLRLSAKKGGPNTRKPLTGKAYDLRLMTDDRS